MRRLSFILVLAILVGGVPIWNAQASATPQTVHSSVLLAQAAAQSSDGIFSGLVSFFNSVIDAVKSTFGFGTPAKVIQQHAVVQSMVKPPTAEVAPLPSTVPPQVREPVKGSAPAPSATVPAQPTAALAAVLGSTAPAPEENLEVTEVKKEGISLYGKIDAKKPVAPTASAASAKQATNTPARDPLGLSKVDTPTPKADVSSKVAAPVTALQGSVAQPSSTPSQPVVATAQEYSASPEQRSVSESRVSSLAPSPQPSWYSQPIIASAPATIRETATQPTVREPIVAQARPRFIDTISIIPQYVPPTRPAAVPEGRVAIAERTPPTVATGDATIPTRPTVESAPPPAEETRVPEPAPIPRPRTIILNNEVIVQTVASTVFVMDLVADKSTECTTSDGSTALSSVEDATGVTHAIVLDGRTVVPNPLAFLKDIVRLENPERTDAERFTTDATPKVCNFAAYLNLLAPEKFFTVPVGFSIAKVVVGVDGAIDTAVVDAEKKLHEIVVIKEDSVPLRKSFPLRQQVVVQTIRGMTVAESRGLTTVDLAMIARDGTISAFQCEFSTTTDMTCTAR